MTESHRKGWLGRLFRREGHPQPPETPDASPPGGEAKATPGSTPTTVEGTERSGVDGPTSRVDPLKDWAEPLPAAAPTTAHELRNDLARRQPDRTEPIADSGPALESVEHAESASALRTDVALESPEDHRVTEPDSYRLPSRAATVASAPLPTPRQGWLARLRKGLSRSSNALTGNIAGIFTRRKLDDETLEELEEALIMADLGVETSARMVQRIAHDRFGREVTELEIREALAAEIAEVLEEVAQPLPARDEALPQVVLIAGVNGVGKTTTIGKLAKQQMLLGRKVMMAACDTFRAAAVEQLEIWGDRNGCPVMKAKTGADAAGLAYDALDRAKREGYDLLLIDTAGRLQNKMELMEELAKIVRVIQKLDPQAPHDVLLVLDATTGQNVFNQVDLFNAMVELTGFVVTKLDGSAKGGVVVALAERFGLPVHAVGVGESIDDLRPFDADAFARSLMGLEQPGSEAA